MQHLRNRALTKVEPVIRAFLNADEFLQTLDGPEDADHALIAFGGHAGIVRVARHADLVLIGHRDDAFQEIGDAFPEHIGIHTAGASEG